MVVSSLEITAISLQVNIHIFHINILSSGIQQLETINLSLTTISYSFNENLQIIILCQSSYLYRR